MHDLCPISALKFSQRFFLPNLVAIGHSWAMWLVVDPADLGINFDPSNALRFVQGFFLLNLVAIEHSLEIWPLVDPSWPLHDIWPHYCTTFRSRVLSTKFGCHRAFLSSLTPADPCITLDPNNALYFDQGSLLPLFFCGSYYYFCLVYQAACFSF